MLTIIQTVYDSTSTSINLILDNIDKLKSFTILNKTSLNYLIIDSSYHKNLNTNFAHYSLSESKDLNFKILSSIQELRSEIQNNDICVIYDFLTRINESSFKFYSIYGNKDIVYEKEIYDFFTPVKLNYVTLIKNLDIMKTYMINNFVNIFLLINNENLKFSPHNSNSLNRKNLLDKLSETIESIDRMIFLKNIDVTKSIFTELRKFLSNISLNEYLNDDLSWENPNEIIQFSNFKNKLINDSVIFKKNHSSIPSITFVSDINQFEYALTNVYMIFSQSKNQENLKFNLVFDSIMDREMYIKNKLDQFGLSKFVNLFFINDKDYDVKSMDTKHITSTGNFKLFLSKIINDESTLYLDNDVVVIGDIFDILVNLDPNITYARRITSHFWVNKIKVISEALSEIGMNYPNELNYFNAGVVHFPLKRLNKDYWNDIISLDKIMNTNDQDLLNGILKINNLPTNLNIAKSSNPVEMEFITNLKIYHFISYHKQWTVENIDDYVEADGDIPKGDFFKMIDAKKTWTSYHKKMWD